jgi:hypothetical protein
MSAITCGLSDIPPDLPDAGQGMCCYGAAIYGPERCTCWVPVYDLEQQEVRPGLPLPRIPVKMCDACAYRPNSPERRGEDGYKGDAEELDRMVATGELFVCHVGIRKPILWRHPSGAEVPGHPAGYDPPIVDSIPYKADGTPADICSGWLLRRAKESSRG